MAQLDLCISLSSVSATGPQAAPPTLHDGNPRPVPNLHLVCACSASDCCPLQFGSKEMASKTREAVIKDAPDPRMFVPDAVALVDCTIFVATQVCNLRALDNVERGNLATQRPCPGAFSAPAFFFQHAIPQPLETILSLWINPKRLCLSAFGIPYLLLWVLLGYVCTLLVSMVKRRNPLPTSLLLL